MDSRRQKTEDRPTAVMKKTLKNGSQTRGKYERQEEPNQIYERQESLLQLTYNIIMARTGWSTARAVSTCRNGIRGSVLQRSPFSIL